MSKIIFNKSKNHLITLVLMILWFILITILLGAVQLYLCENESPGISMKDCLINREISRKES